MSRIIGLMYRIRGCVNNKILSMIYYSLIYPHLLYGIPIWGNADNIHLNPVLILQKKAVRIILNKHRNIHTNYELPQATVHLTLNDEVSLLFDIPSVPLMYWYVDTFQKSPSEPIFKELGILKVQDIYKLSTLKFVYDSLNKHNPCQFHSFYKYPNDLQKTKSIRNNNLDPPMARTETYGIKSLKYSGCILWNDITMAERNAISKNAFSKLIKKKLLHVYNNDETDGRKNKGELNVELSNMMKRVANTQQMRLEDSTSNTNMTKLEDKRLRLLEISRNLLKITNKFLKY